MAHKIALVHGMGEHGTNWSAAVQEQIKQQYEQIKSPLTRGFDDAFEFVEVCYDSVFDAQRQRWKAQSDEVLENLKIGGISSGALNELLEATSSLGKDNFFTTHILDVVLYKWFPLIGEEVRLTVAETFLEIAKSTDDWSIIAHSLGTAVTHDTIQAMFTQQVDGKLLPRSYRPDNIWMVANVSRIVSENQVYRSLVKPTLLIEHGLCEEYFNAQHEYDPFPMVKPFQSDHPDAKVWIEEAGGLYLHVPLKGQNTTELNVHGFSHYLAIPGMFVPLMRSLAGRNSVSKSKLTEYIIAYEAKTVEGQARLVKKRFEQINPADLNTIEDFLWSLRQFYEFLNSLISVDEP